MNQPLEDDDTKVSNDQFVVALRLRWGLPLWPWTPSSWPCRCAYHRHGGVLAADLSIRALSCHFGDFVYRRHDVLIRKILRIGTKASCTLIGRHRNFRTLGVPTGGRRDEDAVDGVFWRGPAGRAVVFDVGIIDPRGRDGVQAALDRWGGAAGAQSAQKHSYYGRDLAAAGWSFWALVWETHGFSTPAVRHLLTAFAAHQFSD